MIEVNSNSLNNTTLAVAEYETIMSALRYAVSYLRGGGNNDSK